MCPESSTDFVQNVLLPPWTHRLIQFVPSKLRLFETKKVLYDLPEASGAIRHHLPTPVDGARCGGRGAVPYEKPAGGERNDLGRCFFLRDCLNEYEIMNR